MNEPDLALAAAYWVHLIATVTWLGGLAALSLLVLPAARSFDPPARLRLLEGIQRRLDPLAWFSLALLVGSGLFQMSASPNYTGFLAVENTWALAILTKHLVIGLMVAASAVMTWGVLPGLRRSALRLSKGVEAPEAEKLHKREVFLLRVNLLLSVVVLALTALARVS